LTSAKVSHHSAGTHLEIRPGFTQSSRLHRIPPGSRLGMYRRGGPGLLTVIYLLIGVFAAGDHNYIQHDTLGEVISAILAILLWPLILLFDVNLHIK
jgi:hypothetical protein